MTAVGLIPARLESSRLPRKLLLAETGRTLLEHTWQAARRASALDELIVATDSAEIAQAVRSFGGRAELTGPHASGTDRIAEVVRRCVPGAEIIVNIQGDEPEIDAAHIDVLVATLAAHSAAQTATLATPIRDLDDLQSPSCVKVVCAADGRALYFSRAAIPFVRDGDPAGVLRAWRNGPGERLSEKGDRHPPSCGHSPVKQQDPGASPPFRTVTQAPAISSQSGHSDQKNPPPPWLLHLGLYAYRREFLLWLTERPASRLEQLEKLEQLRVLEAGATMQVAVVDHRAVGIDTPEDYARFVLRQRARAA